MNASLSQDRRAPSRGLYRTVADRRWAVLGVQAQRRNENGTAIALSSLSADAQTGLPQRLPAAGSVCDASTSCIFCFRIRLPICSYPAHNQQHARKVCLDSNPANSPRNPDFSTGLPSDLLRVTLRAQGWGCECDGLRKVRFSRCRRRCSRACKSLIQSHEISPGLIRYPTGSHGIFPSRSHWGLIGSHEIPS